MTYERDRAMHIQECTEEMIRMRTPVRRQSTPHPDPLADVIEHAAERLYAAAMEIGLVNDIGGWEESNGRAGPWTTTIPAISESEKAKWRRLAQTALDLPK